MEESGRNLRVAIVGAGAAGLFAAGCLKKRGMTPVVFDGNEKAGKKLYITGKGRCNLTNFCAPDEFLQNVVRGEKFLRTAIYNFPPADAVQFFQSLGLATKVERGNRVFPQSDKSSDVIKALFKVYCQGVEFRFEQPVLKIEVLQKNTQNSAENSAENLQQKNVLNDKTSQQKKISKSEVSQQENGAKSEDFREENSCRNENLQDVQFMVKTAAGEEIFDRVIVATGGKSYSSTGSSGFGYGVAKSFGHQIVPIAPALCPIFLKDNFVADLCGVSLKNVCLQVVADGKKQAFFGEMLFTADGISGPIVLTASSHINRAQNVALSIDFKPALTPQQLDARLLREFDAAKNKDVENVLRTLLPRAVAEVFAKKFGLQSTKINAIKRPEREKIVQGLKNFPLCFGGLYPLEAAVVTSGGVDTKQINPKTFESKLQKGLYFVGEVLDVDALTGGFNLQIAWSTAKSCAENLQ